MRTPLTMAITIAFRRASLQRIVGYPTISLSRAEIYLAIIRNKFPLWIQMDKILLICKEQLLGLSSYTIQGKDRAACEGQI